MLRRAEVEPDHVDDLRRELGVGGAAEGGEPVRFEVETAQQPMDRSTANTRRRRQGADAPVTLRLGFLAADGLHHPQAVGVSVDSRSSRTWPVLQSGESLLGKSLAPQAHRAAVHAFALGDRRVLLACSCSQNDASPLGDAGLDPASMDTLLERSLLFRAKSDHRCPSAHAKECTPSSHHCLLTNVTEY